MVTKLRILFDEVEYLGEDRYKCRTRHTTYALFTAEAKQLTDFIYDDIDQFKRKSTIVRIGNILGLIG